MGVWPQGEKSEWSLHRKQVKPGETITRHLLLGPTGASEELEEAHLRSENSNQTMNRVLHPMCSCPISAEGSLFLHCAWPSARGLPWESCDSCSGARNELTQAKTRCPESTAAYAGLSPQQPMQGLELGGGTIENTIRQCPRCQRDALSSHNQRAE